MSKYRTPLDKLRDELKSFISRIEKGSVREAIDSAYEITFKKEILNLLERKKVQLIIPYVVTLDYLYNSWCDWAGDSLEDCVDAALETVREEFVKIQTKFGTIYIEPYDSNEEIKKDKIMLFDSDFRPLGAVSVATYIAPSCDDSYEREYKEFCADISRVETLDALLKPLERYWGFISKDPNKLPQTGTEVEVNRIGEIYFF